MEPAWQAGGVAATNSALLAMGPLLFESARLLDELAQAEVNRQAGRRLMTPALVRLLPHLSRAGVRPTELARRVDVSKQAVGQALGELESLGFVEQVADPSDGRARLVRLTREGEAAYAHGHAVLAFYAGRLADRVGPTRIRGLAASLEAILTVLREWAAGEPPRPRGVGDGSAAARFTPQPERGSERARRAQSKRYRRPSAAAELGIKKR
jgi:DNA-binding MarR family transcriptional regulator